MNELETCPKQQESAALIPNKQLETKPQKTTELTAYPISKTP